MRFASILVLALVTLAGTAYGQSIYLTGPNQEGIVEGKSFTIGWSAGGAETVNIVIHGTRTPRGTTPRGTFLIIAAKGVPAAQGEISYTLPWIDSTKFSIKVKGYDASGRMVGSSEREYRFRPAVMANRLKDGIYLDLHKRRDQRLYVQKDQRIVKAYISSSSESYYWLPPNRHRVAPHDHAGVFRVLEKSPSHWSSLYQVQMRWSMRYVKGHFIHATTPNYYKLLGRPASHGCNRLTRHDAYQLYQSTRVGTRVEVIGPGS